MTRQKSGVAVLTVLAIAAAGCGGQAGGGSESASGSAASQESTAKPVAQVDNLTGRTTAVKLDEEFVAGLEQLKLTPGPVGSAKIKGGSAIFPITGGNVTYYKPGTTSPFVRGLIYHEGSGLSLEGGGTKVELTDFAVNPANSTLTGKVTANGKEAASGAPLFFLNGSTLKPLRTQGDTAILEGTTVTLTREAADLLNETFKTDALKKGFPVGVAKITINTK